MDTTGDKKIIPLGDVFVLELPDSYEDPDEPTIRRVQARFLQGLAAGAVITPPGCRVLRLHPARVGSFWWGLLGGVIGTLAVLGVLKGFIGL